MRFCVLLEEQGVHCQRFELEVWFLHRQPPPLPLHSCLFPVDPDFPSFSGSTSRGSWRGRLVRTRRLQLLVARRQAQVLPNGRLAKGVFKSEKSGLVSVPDAAVSGRDGMARAGQHMYQLHAVMEHIGQDLKGGHIIAHVRRGGQCFTAEDEMSPLARARLVDYKDACAHVYLAWRPPRIHFQLLIPEKGVTILTPRDPRATHTKTAEDIRSSKIHGSQCHAASA